MTPTDTTVPASSERKRVFATASLLDAQKQIALQRGQETAEQKNSTRVRATTGVTEDGQYLSIMIPLAYKQGELTFVSERITDGKRVITVNKAALVVEAPMPEGTQLLYTEGDQQYSLPVKPNGRGGNSLYLNLKAVL